VLKEMIKTGKAPQEIVEERELTRITSRQQILEIIEQVFTKNPKAVKDALIKEEAVHFLIGEVMKMTRGRADPQLTNKLIKERLRELASSRKD
jgi:aspartyl-tRNA(Asn)/glutamyl-tRNA(Gln) amidotransferase subunit B